MTAATETATLTELLGDRYHENLIGKTLEIRESYYEDKKSKKPRKAFRGVITYAFLNPFNGMLALGFEKRKLHIDTGNFNPAHFKIT